MTSSIYYTSKGWDAGCGLQLLPGPALPARSLTAFVVAGLAGDELEATEREGVRGGPGGKTP